MAVDFQSDFDTLFFDEDSVFSEEITGTPAGGSETTLYANIYRGASGVAKMRGGSELSFRQLVIGVSKTDWPVVTKNQDKFNISVNGSIEERRVVSVVYEDSISYKLALA